MKGLLDTGIIPTAVFATSDLRAWGGIRAATEKGLRVPDDIAFVGFDNVDLGGVVSPTLTTVDRHRYQMGQEAVKIVWRLIREGRGQQKLKKVLETELVIRESSGPPRAKTGYNQRRGRW